MSFDPRIQIAKPGDPLPDAANGVPILQPPIPKPPDPDPWSLAMAGYFRRTIPRLIQGVSVEAQAQGEDPDAAFEFLCGTPEDRKAKNLVEGKPIHPGVWNDDAAWAMYERALAIRLHQAVRESTHGLSAADLQMNAIHELVGGMQETLRQWLSEPIKRPLRIAFLLPIRPPMLFVGWRNDAGDTFLAYDHQMLRGPSMAVDWGKGGDSVGKQRLREAIASHACMGDAPEIAVEALRPLVDKMDGESWVMSLGDVRQALQLAGLG